MPRHISIYHIYKLKKESHKAILKENYHPFQILQLFVKKNKQTDIKIKDTMNSSKEFKDEYIIIAIDSTGIKVTTRCRWIRENGIKI